MWVAAAALTPAPALVPATAPNPAPPQTGPPLATPLGGGEDGEKCCVCQHALGGGDDMIQFICGHSLHDECFNKYYESIVTNTLGCRPTRHGVSIRCPICRKSQRMPDPVLL